MIKGKWKNYTYQEKHCEDELIVTAENRKTDKVDHQNGYLGGYHIRKNCSDEETLLTFEDCMAGGTPISDPERSLNN
jgi:hypothetical protein